MRRENLLNSLRQPSTGYQFLATENIRRKSSYRYLDIPGYLSATIATGGGGSGDLCGGGDGDGGGPIMINSLLCSVLRALTRTAATDLSSVIVREVTLVEIKKAWLQLFTFFKDVEYKTQKKSVLDITRATTGALVDDILKQLSEYDRSTPA